MRAGIGQNRLVARVRKPPLTATRPALFKLPPLEWAKLLVGNGLLIAFLATGRLELIDLLLLMSLEAVGLNLATMVVALATGRMPARELVGYLIGLVFLLGWGWIWTLAMLVDQDTVLWARVFAAPGDPESLLRQPQIVAPLLATLAGVLITPSFAELSRSALSPAMQMFAGPTLGLMVALFGSALLGSGRIEPVIFTVVFLASRVGLDLLMRHVPTDEIFSRPQAPRPSRRGA